MELKTLQCFALKAKLSSMGHALTVIDHRNNNLEKRYDLFPSQNWKCNPILSVKIQSPAYSPID